MQTEIQTLLNKLSIRKLNEMQQQSLEMHQKHKQVVLLSPTGSGKTLAFLLPVLQQIRPNHRGAQVLIVAPTRELSLQIEEVFKSMSTKIGVTCCYGGHKREIEENNLTNNPAVIIGTPGRLCDHFRRGNIHPESIFFFILDEFDKALELGFQEEITFLKNALPNLERCTLASATDAEEIEEFLGITPEKINFLTEEKRETSSFSLQYLQTIEEDKFSVLEKLLCFHGGKNSVIFCNFREDVEKCSSLLSKDGIHNVFYHGAMEQRDRETALCKFQNGSSHYLVTTDLAARGLDFDHIRYVIHFQLPLDQKSFVHRNGRTARMDKSGTGILLLSKHEFLPKYISSEEIEQISLPEESYPLPERPQWTTVYVAAGKKNKVNKIDIVGFLAKKGQLKMEDIGKIEVKDFHSFVAIRRTKASSVLHLIKEEKLKGKKVWFEIAK